MIERKDKKEKTLTNNGQMINFENENGQGFITKKDSHNDKEQITNQILIKQQK